MPRKNVEKRSLQFRSIIPKPDGLYVRIDERTEIQRARSVFSRERRGKAENARLGTLKRRYEIRITAHAVPLRTNVSINPTAR